ncbi:MAG TPA: DUF3488 and transglutaminase-like domain-containing protein [Pseudomonadales bacterium]
MQDYRIARPVFIWILLAQFFLLLPHMLRYPLLLVPGWLLLTVWRIQVFRGRWQYPSSKTKAVLVVLVMSLVAISQPRFFTIETMVILLLLAFLLKLVETATWRDLLVGVYLAYFVIVTQLLFEQGIFAAVYMLVALLLVTSTLVAAHADVQAGFWFPCREAGKMLLFSLPLMLVAFLVFPRIEPLWVLPQPSASGKTGISDSMSPGMIAELAQSDELAFRAEFDGMPPALSQLYWRGMVFSHFDGLTWRRSSLRHERDDMRRYYQIDDNMAAFRYRVIMEPSQQRWMFPLPGTVEHDSGAIDYDDFTLQQRQPIMNREAWQFVSYPAASRPWPVNNFRHRDSLQLPDGFNPRTLALARQLRAGADSDADFVERVLDYFRNNGFVYTLTPPRLGRNTVDEFLFETRQGFCEHYAGAFTVLMRAAGIPARVVAGYQGGDINPYEQHVTVRQLDAHAWTEVWLEGRGWQRVDPTYAVSPDRIEQGGQQSLADEPDFLSRSPLSPARFSARLGWLRKLQYRLDQANYLWHSWVLSYEGRQQQDVLRALLGQVSLKRIALLVLGSFVVTGLLVWLLLFWRHRPARLSPDERLLQHLQRKLRRAGLERQPGQGPQAFVATAAQRYPASARTLKEIGRLYLLIRYARLSAAKKQQLRHRLRRHIRTLRVE